MFLMKRRDFCLSIESTLTQKFKKTWQNCQASTFELLFSIFDDSYVCVYVLISGLLTRSPPKHQSFDGINYSMDGQKSRRFH